MHNIDFEKIARYLSDEMERDELKGFRQELSQNSALKTELELTEKIWVDMKPIPSDSMQTEIDTHNAWENLSGRLEKDGLLPSQNRIAAALPGWLKIAATVLLFVSLGFATWFIAGIRSDDQLLTLTTDDTDVTLVQKLIDGSVVYMASNSLISFSKEFEKKQRKINMSGEAFFDVSHNPDQPFYVETALAGIEVLGTSFNVKELDTKSMEIFVETGKVRVNLRGSDGNFFILEQGELLEISNGLAGKTYAADTYNTAWRKNHMQFKDETLENILSVLNQNFPVKMMVEHPELNQRKLTVTFYNTSPEIIGDLIAISLDIDHVTSDDNVITFRNKY
ncbi:MAG: FecR domain-containing protein [Bacteroidales bacterium]|nr:FecR domain-containing protein [Bacteroidales bacterium]